jgi:predicted phage tail protein
MTSLRQRRRKRGDDVDAQREPVRGNEDDRSIRELVGDLSSQVARLARLEASLAARQMTRKAKQGAAGAGAYGVAGVLALYAGGALIAGLVAAIAEGVPVWAAALIVSGALLVAAGVAALVARALMRRSVPPTPDDVGERVHEDIEALKGRSGS